MSRHTITTMGLWSANWRRWDSVEVAGRGWGVVLKVKGPNMTVSFRLRDRALGWLARNDWRNAWSVGTVGFWLLAVVACVVQMAKLDGLR